MRDVGYPYVLALGDSLTAGYGLSPRDAFPAQLQRLLREHHPDAVVQNAGVAGDTSANALARLPRLLSSLQSLPNLAIVELGANDFLRGVPLPIIRANLDAILIELGRCGIHILIAAMEAPRFLGAFADACDAVYGDVARHHNAQIHPFYPPGILGQRALALPDGVHPNARAVGLIAHHMRGPTLAALTAAGAAAVR